MDKKKIEKTIEHLKTELSGIRTGRAAPTIVENINIEVYGQKTPLSGLASISSPEPQTLVIAPWDKNIIKDIEKGISESDLDLAPSIQGDVVRLNFPPLTEEKRKELVKIVGQKVEEAKIAVKNIREEMIKELKDKKNKKELSEDDFFRQEKDIQSEIEKYNEQIKEISESKEKEIMTV